MNKPQKIAVAVTGALVLLGVGGAGISAYMTDVKLQALQADPKALGEFRLVALNHTKGFMESSGDLKLRYASKCEPSLTFDLPVEYRVQHFPLPWAPVRYDFKVVPPAEVAQAVESVTGNRFELKGEGYLSPLGTLHVHFKTPSVSSNVDGNTLDIPVSQWNISVNRPAVEISWALDSVSYRSEHDVFTLKNAKIDIDLSDYKRGLGSSSFEVEQVATKTFDFRGFVAKGVSKEHGGAIDHKSESVLASMTVAGKTFKDLKANIELTGLHAASMETLMRLFEDTCAFGKATVAENKEARDAIRQMLQSGIGLSMSKLDFGLNDGNFHAEFGVKLGASSGDISLQKNLSFHAKAELTGNLLNEQEKQMALNSGFVTQNGQSLASSVEFLDGRLQLNGKPADPVYVQRLSESLGMADAGLKAVLTEGDLKLPGLFPQAGVEMPEVPVEEVSPGEMAVPEDLPPEYYPEGGQMEAAPPADAEYVGGE